jgi:hypothetical protein
VKIGKNQLRFILKNDETIGAAVAEYGDVLTLQRWFLTTEPGIYQVGTSAAEIRELRRLEVMAQAAEERIRWNREFDLKQREYNLQETSYKNTRQISIAALLISLLSLLATIAKMVLDSLHSP